MYANRDFKTHQIRNNLKWCEELMSLVTRKMFKQLLLQFSNLDNLSLAELELEGFAAAARVELLVVRLEPARVVHADSTAGLETS